MGEIGGTDYNNAFFQAKLIQQIITYIPFVVNEIMNAIREIINLRGTWIVVPGNFPIGCIPLSTSICVFSIYSWNRFKQKYLLIFSLGNKNILKKKLIKLQRVPLHLHSIKILIIRYLMFKKLKTERLFLYVMLNWFAVTSIC